MSYVYIKNKEEFEKEYPYRIMDIKKYPDQYPCVLWYEQKTGGLNGAFYDIEIIEDIYDFIYKDGSLYKKC